jgi:hypothetical protein
MKTKVSVWFYDSFLTFSVLLSLYITFAFITAVQSYSLGPKIYPSGKEYTNYNNFEIFSNAPEHLLKGENLYTSYPDEYWDLYKYSPTFAFLFAPLSVLPALFGLIIWNLLNALVLFFAIRNLPAPLEKRKLMLLLSIIIELITSLQNQQSNGLMAGLMIGAFVMMERKKIFLAAAFLALSVYIKLFGIAGFALFLFYDDRWKAALYSIFWMAVLFVLPLPVTGFHGLIWQYGNWWDMLAADRSASLGFSVMGWLSTWFGINIDKNIVLSAGAILFFVPFLRFRHWKNRDYRILMLALTLIWVVIFNHKAESPTFIIAMAGAAIWYFNSERSTVNTVLFILAVIFTSLAPTEIFPREIRVSVFEPYVVKVVPIILIWVKAFADSFRINSAYIPQNQEL